MRNFYISKIVQELRDEGWSITEDDLSNLSPYLTEHLKRYGDYILNLNIKTENIEKIKANALFA